MEKTRGSARAWHWIADHHCPHLPSIYHYFQLSRHSLRTQSLTHSPTFDFGTNREIPNTSDQKGLLPYCATVIVDQSGNVIAKRLPLHLFPMLLFRECFLAPQVQKTILVNLFGSVLRILFTFYYTSETFWGQFWEFFFYDNSLFSVRAAPDLQQGQPIPEKQNPPSCVQVKILNSKYYQHILI